MQVPCTSCQTLCNPSRSFNAPSRAGPLCPFCTRFFSERQNDFIEFPYETERVRLMSELRKLTELQTVLLNVLLNDIDGEKSGSGPDQLGFVTTFTAVGIEVEVGLAATARNYSSKLNDLERLLRQLMLAEAKRDVGGPRSVSAPAPSGEQNGSAFSASESEDNTSNSSVSRGSHKSGGHSSATDHSKTQILPHTEVKNAVTAYFHILDVAERLELADARQIIEHAMMLFKHCSSRENMRTRHVESIATAALLTAMRQRGSPRTIQELSFASGISQKEIGRYLKLLNESLRGNPEQKPPETSLLLSDYMPRFCRLLTLPQRTQDLATHIGNELLKQTFSTRGNPVSISAASIYMACQLEDVRRTQSEVCKATGLTEVTVRKCYRELVGHLKTLLPPGYVPAVQLEKIMAQGTRPAKAAPLPPFFATLVPKQSPTATAKQPAAAGAGAAGAAAAVADTPIPFEPSVPVESADPSASAAMQVDPSPADVPAAKLNT